MNIEFYIFFCYGDFIILTHEFTKKTKKVPEKEIEKAIKIRNDFKSRFSEEKLRKELQ
ncbi:MAG: type II toxin-antitoxin system RelE/ParE family toxin [Thiomargarita sp.]|nr:type II toxin-antitoxin system RelE/ParE family toxin [Thiomargarita sp.]